MGGKGNGLSGVVYVGLIVIIFGNVHDVVDIKEQAVKVVLASFILGQDLLESFVVESIFFVYHLLFLFSPSVLQANGLVEHKIVGCGVEVGHEIADTLELQILAGLTLGSVVLDVAVVDGLQTLGVKKLTEIALVG